MLHRNLRTASLHAPSQELTENNTGSTISKLKVVTLDQMGTNFPQIKLANPISNINFGIVVADILNTKVGYICCIGFINNIDTSLWLPNTTLYSDTSGNLSTTVLGPPVAKVIKQHVTTGVIYVLTLTSISSESGHSDWILSGNSGTNSLTDFIGTTDAQGLSIRTNNLQRIFIDSNGRVGIGESAPQRLLHLKGYSGYTNSGMQVDTFSLNSLVNTYTNAYSITIPQNSIVKIEWVANARQSDGNERASFKRSGLFYRHGGNVQLQTASWQSDYQAKSNNAFNVNYSTTVTDVNLTVKNANNSDTAWSGHVIVEILQTNL